MSNKMLIDATHPEETRVVVLRGNRVEEFDFEAADRQQLRGNIYLAKVTRVEPSLQAAFVDYGGNRHGFLAFSEIHPDYYQIPFADRQALLQEQAREEEEEAAEDEAADDAAAEVAEAAAEASAGGGEAELVSEAAEASSPDPQSAGEEAPTGETEASAEAPEVLRHDVAEVGHDEADHVESVGAEDALEEVPERRKPRPRQYKIQEVIKRRQVLLVQVVKEERGNKGAALTTYLSLAGRYSVLMPNTGRGGGISRKITNPADRKRLKSIASELDVPEGMGVILRTAGANRTKTEVKRDFEYLLRLWENVRELTLRSTAPKLVYEEGSLIKRSIRDLYSREIEQVVVAGDDAYREAKDFMRMLMPSHAKNVQQYRDTTPIFARSGVEAQLDAMFSPQVTLKSGGYIVINQTEALVSIDVNSGRSTREHSIEDTALNTNLEAAEEIARQLRLRDLAGLIVIDFIDMEENRNNRSVERKLKDCLRADRARIQVGRISHFGLMEMSRQRIRTGVLESSTVSCPHCRGTGQVRSISSLSLQILRALEDNLLRQSGHHLYVRSRPEVALYVLNQKRAHLAELEVRFGLTITVTGDIPTNGAGFMVERGAPVEERPDRVVQLPIVQVPENLEDPDVEIEEAPELEEADESEEAREGQESGEGRERSKRRRRRRRGTGDDRQERHEAGREIEEPTAGDAELEEVEASGAEPSRASEAEDDESGQDSRRRRRGRRGGRRRGRGRENGDVAAGPDRTGEAALADSDGEGYGDDEFAPDEPSEAGTAEQSAASALDDAGISIPLEEASAEQAAGLFGADLPTGDAHAEEVEALTAAAARNGEQGPDARPRNDDENATVLAPRDQLGPVDEFLPFERSEDGSEPPPALVAKDATPETERSDAPDTLLGPAVFTPVTEDDAATNDPDPREPARAPEPAAPEAIEDDRPKRSGWWNRRSFF
ncbi:MAG: Rne/Rng family ribonuclease [Rhizobiales bacterium]|nr:Rne/Rng family ribonuclease [Hyphomicrobiales bacterium]